MINYKNILILLLLLSRIELAKGNLETQILQKVFTEYPAFSELASNIMEYFNIRGLNLQNLIAKYPEFFQLLMTELNNADAIQSISNSISVLKDRIAPLMSYVGTIATSVP